MRVGHYQWKKTYEDQHLQNVLDAESIYNILENEIIPTYFDQDDKGVSEKWVSFIKNIIAEVAPDFTMKRMLDHYFERFYNQLGTRSKKVSAKKICGSSPTRCLENDDGERMA